MMFTPFRSYFAVFGLVMLSGLFQGCASGPKPETRKAETTKPAFTGLRIEQGPASVGGEPRTQKISALILHYTATPLPASLDVLQGRKANHKVGVHYLVTDEAVPRIIQLMPETMAAYHAGKSGWGALEGMNQHSVGIEVVNLDGNQHAYSPAQAELLFALCADIIRRNQIHPTMVLGHSDVSVGRKVDPGALFPWPYLASLGVGAWPLQSEVRDYERKGNKLGVSGLRRLLTLYGYRLEPGEAGLRTGIEAFQRHFRASKIDGVADTETVAILEALVRRYHPSARFKP